MNLQSVDTIDSSSETVDSNCNCGIIESKVNNLRIYNVSCFHGDM